MDQLNSSRFTVISGITSNVMQSLDSFARNKLSEIGASDYVINLGAPYVVNGRLICDTIYIINFFR